MSHDLSNLSSGSSTERQEGREREGVGIGIGRCLLYMPHASSHALPTVTGHILAQVSLDLSSVSNFLTIRPYSLMSLVVLTVRQLSRHRPFSVYSFDLKSGVFWQAGRDVVAFRSIPACLESSGGVPQVAGQETLGCVADQSLPPP